MFKERKSCDSPLLVGKVLGSFFQPPCVNFFWQGKSTLGFAMVSGCKGQPLWLMASPLHMFFWFGLGSCFLDGYFGGFVLQFWSF